MPKIVPIRYLKDTAALSNMVREAADPIYVTKNGHEDMVIMSSELYDRKLYLLDVYEKIEEAEDDLRSGRVIDADIVMGGLKEKYEL